MRERFDDQHWWPGESPFESVSRDLTQKTAWLNVKRAIATQSGAFAGTGNVCVAGIKLAVLIRPAGYFNVKARRLRSFLRVLVEEFGGDLKKLFAGETSAVRERLLAINGVGPETATACCFMPAGNSSFVIDADTKRIFQRHGWKGKCGMRNAECGKHREASYDELKELCELALNRNWARRGWITGRIITRNW